jgi:hypothetical protein
VQEKQLNAFTVKRLATLRKLFNHLKMVRGRSCSHLYRNATVRNISLMLDRFVEAVPAALAIMT